MTSFAIMSDLSQTLAGQSQTLTNSKRNHHIDNIRTFALLGICLVNVPIMGMTESLYHTPPETTFGLGLKLVFESLFMMKFFLLFSFAFGWSVFTQFESMKAKGLDPKPSYFHRIVGLVSLGVLHALLVFHGDILVLYGLVALILWGFKDCSVENLIRYAKWSIFATLFTLLVLVVIAGEETLMSQDARLGGTYTDGMMFRFDSWLPTFGLLVLLQAPLVLSAFLLGLASAKSPWFTKESTGYKALAKKCMPYSVLGILGSLFFAWTNNYGQFEPSGLVTLSGLVVILLTAPLLTASYLYLIVKLDTRLSFPNIIRLASRNTLSCYVLQGVLAGFCFAEYGMGWFNQLSYPQLVLVAFMVYLVSSIMIGMYAKVFGKGPLEPLLRRIAFGR